MREPMRDDLRGHDDYSFCIYVNYQWIEWCVEWVKQRQFTHVSHRDCQTSTFHSSESCFACFSNLIINLKNEEKNLKVFVTLSVKESAVIKELSNNLQAKIKTAIKKTSDLEVKEVNISIKELQTKEIQGLEQ